MNILVLPSQYPYPGFPFCGIFNERGVGVLSKLCERVEVLTPRPYVPPFFSFLSARWKAYDTALGYEIKNGISVYRPAYPQFPGVDGAFFVDQVAFFCSRQRSKKMHRRGRFDVILSFDLNGTGAMAWKIGRYLGIPSAGWVTWPGPSTFLRRKMYIRALTNLDIIFYQSQECLEAAASLLRVAPNQMSQDRHIVLGRGIPQPPLLPRGEIRKRIREEWGIADDQVLVLTIGSINRRKGIYELVDAMSLARARNSKIRSVAIGSIPAFKNDDETTEIQKKLNGSEAARGCVTILPACDPVKVWEYLCAADIFAFPSHDDGMPNALLEAMAMGVPAIAFAIPPVVEVESGRGGILTVPPFNATLFSEAILRLASSPQERTSIGEIGKAEVMDRFMMHKNMAKALQYLKQLVDPGLEKREVVSSSQHD